VIQEVSDGGLKSLSRGKPIHCCFSDNKRDMLQDKPRASSTCSEK
jgi:hypothetical protein